MLENIQAVIFDLDGTLMDSMWIWEDIDITYLKKFGKECTPGLQQIIEGMSMTETAIYFKKIFQIPDSLEKMKSDWNDMARDKYLNEILPKPGAREFVQYLREKGIKTGIASSNSWELIEGVLKANEMEHLFDSIHSCCEVENGKPSPDIYLLVAKELGVNPQHCLVFEDVPMGILAGINAGMKTCGVADEASEDQREEKQRLADYYINDFRELLSDDWK